MSNVDYPEFIAIAPDVQAALTALGKAVDASGLEKGLTELVKLRVSLLNGCGFCVQYHLDLARRLGVEGAKLDLVAAWRDAGVYSSREMAALAWAESLTLSAAAPPPHDGFARLLPQFTRAEAIFLTAAIGAINAWNRLGVGLGFSPASAKG